MNNVFVVLLFVVRSTGLSLFENSGYLYDFACIFFVIEYSFVEMDKLVV